MSNTLRPHGLQLARLPCPSSTPGVYSNSCPLSQWCHPTILSSVIPFSCLQSRPASGSFPMSQFFASGGQSIGVSASASVLPMNNQYWFPLGLTGLISLLSKDSQKSLPPLSVVVKKWDSWIFSTAFSIAHWVEMKCQNYSMEKHLWNSRVKASKDLLHKSNENSGKNCQKFSELWKWNTCKNSESIYLRTMAESPWEEWTL